MTVKHLLDMVHHNPGEPRFVTKWTDPEYLREQGYTGQVPRWFVQCAITYASLAPELFASDPEALSWIESEAASIAAELARADAAGMPLYPFTDFLVLPRALLQKLGAELTSDGQLDVTRPMTRTVIVAQLTEIFERFPSLSGLTVRFGETYLHDTPFHGGGRPMPTEGDAAIRGHVALIQLLREELCVKRGKTVFYRTWDFGHFHDRRDFYLAVTGAILPHERLVFSVKHQRGDFHRMSVFNPTLTLGHHGQIVEVQCQLEAYGKGAHPYYVGRGVIEGWDEYETSMPSGAPRGLRDVIGHPAIVGVWLWSRGGGWDGPRIAHELWCDVNAYVVSRFALRPACEESELLAEYAREVLGLSEEDTARFRELCWLSADAVVRGQLSRYGHVPVWWCRDCTIDEPDPSDLLQTGHGPEALEEKATAVALWQRIEALAHQIEFRDSATREFARVSATYGRIKYAIFEQLWTLAIAVASANGGPCDRYALARALAEHDRLWEEWRRLGDEQPMCPTLYRQDASPHSSRRSARELVAQCRLAASR